MKCRFLRTVCVAGLCLAVLTGAALAGSVRIVVPQYSARTGPYFADAEREFEAANPDIDIQIEMVPWEELHRKLATEMGNGTNPDLAIINRRDLVDFVKLDAIKTLDSRINDEFKGRFISSFLSMAVMDGKVQ